MAIVEFTKDPSVGGWAPLPTGGYDVQIDEIEEATSGTGNPSLKVRGHVVGGPHDDKKVVIWYSLMERAGWKVEALLEASGIDYEVQETDDGENFRFDTDELVGCYIHYDVKEAEYEGKPKNNFNNEAPSKLSGDVAEQAEPEEKPATRRGGRQQASTETAEKPSGGRRRRRVSAS
jgi:hypothetical protein